MIKLLVPSLPKAEDIYPYLKRIDEARWYSNFGPLVRDLEGKLSERYGGAHVVTVANCTLGLELVWSLKRQQGVLCAVVPSLTFPATGLAPHRAGLPVHLTDVDAETWSSPGVCSFGASQQGMVGVLDAAGAFGAQKIIPHSETAVFSLHATKPLGAGEGGYIVTHDASEAQEYREMQNFAFRQGQSTGEGTNAKMSEYHAAVALAALERWQEAPWLDLHDWYADSIPEGVVAQKRPRGCYSLMPVKLPCRVEPVQSYLLEHGIETRRWYWPPLHRHPLFKGSGGDFPVTDSLSDSLIGLPYHLSLSRNEVSYICDTLGRAIRLSEPRNTALRVHQRMSPA